MVQKWRRINVDATWLRRIDVNTRPFSHQMPAGTYSLAQMFEPFTSGGVAYITHFRYPIKLEKVLLNLFILWISSDISL